MREQILDAINNLKGWGWPADAAVLQELLDVADGLKQRAESGKDNTELMQRARKLLDPNP